MEKSMLGYSRSVIPLTTRLKGSFEDAVVIDDESDGVVRKRNRDIRGENFC
jgi:hypothetical protein